MRWKNSRGELALTDHSRSDTVTTVTVSNRHCNYSDPSRKALYAQCTSANNPQNTQNSQRKPTSVLRCERVVGEQAVLCATSREVGAVFKAVLRALRAPPLPLFLLLLQTPRLLQRARDRRSPLYMRAPLSTLLQQGVVGERTTHHNPWQRDTSLCNGEIGS